MRDEFEREYWGWLRWIRLRWRLVDAFERAAHHIADNPMATCTRPECCAVLAELAPLFGITLESSESDSSRLWFDDRFHEFIGEGGFSRAHDGVIMLNGMYSMRDLARPEPFAGFMEVPDAVARIIVSDHFRGRWERSKLLPTEDAFDVNREFVYALTLLAFPDEYLDRRHGSGSDSLDSYDSDSDDDFDRLPTVVIGQGAYDNLSAQMRSAGYVPPLLSPLIIEQLRLDASTMEIGTPHFGYVGEFPSFPLPVWDPLAAYDLAFGAEGACLRNYWEDIPSVPWVFSYCERSNQAGTGMCFIVRSLSVFVSQQVWVSSLNDDKDLWNRCTTAYNFFVAPILETTGPDGAAMVAFSGFRGDAYIVSNVPESWDEYAPMSRVLAPLPDGWGIVGVWLGYESDRYTPRPLEQIIRRDYSEQITACAQYLKECLAALSDARRA